MALRVQDKKLNDNLFLSFILLITKIVNCLLLKLFENS